MRAGDVIGGRYELVVLLGRGGMGEVWGGRDRVLRREVAVKLLHTDGGISPELPARFEREAVDFGLAGFTQTMLNLARSSQLTPAGTPLYGAPEQFGTTRGMSARTCTRSARCCSRCSARSRRTPARTDTR